MAGMRPLRRRVIEDMTVRNLSPATNDRMYMLLPGSAASSGVRLTSVISRTCERSRFIWSLAGYQPALNQTVCARIASGFTLKQTDLPERIPYGREPRRWPVVLGADEVVRFPGSGAQPKGACRADYGLCGRTARVGSSEPQGRQLSGARSSASDKWRNMAVNLPRQVAGRSGCDGTLWPEMNGIAGFALSHWQHKRDNIGTGWDVFMPAAMFAAALRRWQGWEYSAKEKVPMYSPTLFAAELEPIKNSGKDNALIMRGIILDIEHSTSSPEGFPAIFPELQMVLYSSFNHTEESPRYRICIPTTHFVTPQINEVIGWTIARVRSGHTVWIPANSTAPPCSIVPITAPRCS